MASAHAQAQPGAAAGQPAAMEAFGCRNVSCFEKLDRIGEGTYGTVFRARDKESGAIVALKKVKVVLHNGFPLTSVREIKLLLKLDHPNIVKLHEVVVGHRPDSIFLVFEYCEHDFASLLDRMKRRWTDSEIKCILLQLLEALHHLHSNFIVHRLAGRPAHASAHTSHAHTRTLTRTHTPLCCRDLKLSNMLMNNKGILKLADFGLARLFGNPLEPFTPKVITLWFVGCRAHTCCCLPRLRMACPGTAHRRFSWAAPSTTQLWTCGTFCFARSRALAALRRWPRALGCIFGELLKHRPLLPGTTELNQLELIFKLLGKPTPKIAPTREWAHYEQLTAQLPDYRYNTLRDEFASLSDQGVDLLSRLLTYDPSKRITAEKALEHPYFREKPLPKEPSMMPTFPSQSAAAAAAAAAARHAEAASSVGVRARTGSGIFGDSLESAAKAKRRKA